MLAAAVAATAIAGAPAPPTDVYVGIYNTHEPASCPKGGGFDSKGYTKDSIYHYHLGEDGGLTGPLNTAEAGMNASWIAFHPVVPRAYAVNEVCTFDGKSRAGITTLEVRTDSSLKAIARLDTVGMGPVQATISHDGRFLFVAFYFSGDLEVYRIEHDGSLHGPTQVIKQGPATHSAVIDPRGGSPFVMSAVLGKDEIHQYSLSTNGTLDLISVLKLATGTGPRHIAFSPPGVSPVRAFVADEGNATTPSRISVCSFNPEKGVLELEQTLSTLAAGWNSTDMYPAEVAVSNSGKFVYVSVRDASLAGRDSIAVFEAGETVSKIAVVSSGGHYPRSMTLTPDGKFILVANQFSNQVVTFAVDQRTGIPSRTDAKPATLPDSAAFVAAVNFA
eukprot:TRINITY_DN35456_c0_g1_i1.p1 TRINITY_DN35456_c0_g1~~TRINITY_DN35456_c0_g1_i1.p1  ORF type:complete len:416 (+),score=122.39 TRINITY_DN35456_c0_g1_i1:79-1248(+)